MNRAGGPAAERRGFAGLRDDRGEVLDLVLDVAGQRVDAVDWN